VRVQRQQEERHAGDDVADDGDIPRHAGMMRSNRWRCSAGMARLDGRAAKGAIKIGQRGRVLSHVASSDRTSPPMKQGQGSMPRHKRANLPRQHTLPNGWVRFRVRLLHCTVRPLPG
jgi:hypothetical protein